LYWNLRGPNLYSSNDKQFESSKYAHYELNIWLRRTKETTFKHTLNPRINGLVSAVTHRKYGQKNCEDTTFFTYL